MILTLACRMGIKNHILRLAKSADCLVTVSSRLSGIARSHDLVNNQLIRCHTAVEDEWLTAPKSWRGRWRKEKTRHIISSRPKKAREKSLPGITDR